MEPKKAQALAKQRAMAKALRARRMEDQSQHVPSPTSPVAQTVD